MQKKIKWYAVVTHGGKDIATGCFVTKSSVKNWSVAKAEDNGGVPCEVKLYKVLDNGDLDRDIGGNAICYNTWEVKAKPTKYVTYTVHC